MEKRHVEKRLQMLIMSGSRDGRVCADRGVPLPAPCTPFGSKNSKVREQEAFVDAVHLAMVLCFVCDSQV